MNVGKLVQGRAHLKPCTPAGVIEILQRSGVQIGGRHAVVIGRSEIVGKPMAMLLLQRDATVTICHSKTPDLPSVAARGDILVAAIGRPGFVTGAFVRPGATVIDVGTTPVSDRAKVCSGSSVSRRWSRRQIGAEPHLFSVGRPHTEQHTRIARRRRRASVRG